MNGYDFRKPHTKLTSATPRALKTVVIATLIQLLIGLLYVIVTWWLLRDVQSDRLALFMDYISRDPGKYFVHLVLLPTSTFLFLLSIVIANQCKPIVMICILAPFFAWAFGYLVWKDLQAGFEIRSSPAINYRFENSQGITALIESEKYARNSARDILLNSTSERQSESELHGKLKSLLNGGKEQQQTVGGDSEDDTDSIFLRDYVERRESLKQWFIPGPIELSYLKEIYETLGRLPDVRTDASMRYRLSWLAATVGYTQTALLLVWYLWLLVCLANNRLARDSTAFTAASFSILPLTLWFPFHLYSEWQHRFFEVSPEASKPLMWMGAAAFVAYVCLWFVKQTRTVPILAPASAFAIVSVSSFLYKNGIFKEIGLKYAGIDSGDRFLGWAFFVICLAFILMWIGVARWVKQCMPLRVLGVLKPAEHNSALAPSDSSTEKPQQ